MNVPGCQDTQHETTLWPDEKAKLYFFPKPSFNPGLTKLTKANPKEKQIASNAAQICKCDFFKDIVPYENIATKFMQLKIAREKAKDDPRACLNWGCEKHFTEAHNGEKDCLSHPGKWDHGSTGNKMEAFINEFSQDAPANLLHRKIQWRPHWTCCDGGWEDVGCERVKHKGPLVEEGESAREYVWPGIRLKLCFKKTVSKYWKKNLDKFMYDEDKVKRICHKYFSGGRVDNFFFIKNFSYFFTIFLRFFLLKYFFYKNFCSFFFVEKF